MPLKLYNTLSRKVEIFKPIKNKKVGLYVCGPTVYDYAHIGNLRSYITWDILRRILTHDGYKVKQVMNITDVGHLTSDADEGEDKIEKGAAREKKTALEIADFYSKAFIKNLADLNVETPEIICRATDHIKEQIKLVKKLEKKGFTYLTADGVYFDTSKLNNYGILARLKKQELRAGARIDAHGKRHHSDFALWKLSPKLQKRQMEWDSPWGVGFPGWHIECSAMSKKYLGLPFDIHTGGIDHIPVHHTNEIAQTEAADGVIPARYWMHNEFLTMGDKKMAKSKGGFITLHNLQEKKYSPLAYRYLLLQTHYRKQLKFSFEALKAAETGLKHLCSLGQTLVVDRKTAALVKNKFYSALNNDLDTPKALSILWQAVKEKSISQKILIEFDGVLGLGLEICLSKKDNDLPNKVNILITERDKARQNKDWAESDRLRDQIVKMGYEVMDTAEGTKAKLKT